KGIIIKSHSMKGVSEEAPEAYKEAEKVVNVMHEADIARKVVMVRPLICIKG
ncbi:MAG: RtcB family protein, partial [Nanoarchaeota archaeon]|nr:RtcB family protein [Nanoarchaeota archaeon]